MPAFNRRTVSESVPILAALSMAFVAYLVVAPALRWLSLDDYLLVYGTPMRPWPTFLGALRDGGGGSLSTHRLLCYPFIGYVGGWLGPAAAHALQGGLHLVCAAVFYALLRRLRWAPAPAALATAGFAVAPWASEPVFWWSAVCTILSTLFVLLAAHAYVSWSRSDYRSRLVLLTCIGCAFVSLLLYELWLAGYILFVAIEMWLTRANLEAHATSRVRSIVLAVKRSWPLSVPYLVWVIIFMLTYRAAVHRPQFDAVRVPIVLASIHLRAYHWFAGTPWVSALGAGSELPPWALAVAAAAGVLMFRAVVGPSRDRVAAANIESSGAEREPLVSVTRVPLLEVLWLSWGMFLASRLVFVFQGGVATHTRHNYGAAIGVAMAGAGVVTWLQSIRPSKTLHLALGLTAAATLLVCTITTAGLGVQYREMAKAEELTYEVAAASWSSGEPDSTIVVVGQPEVARGEAAYFPEESGVGLERRLRLSDSGVHAYIVPSADVDGEYLNFIVDRRPRGNQVLMRLQIRRTTVLIWRRGHLERLTSSPFRTVNG